MEINLFSFNLYSETKKNTQIKKFFPHYCGVCTNVTNIEYHKKKFELAGVQERMRENKRVSVSVQCVCV